jgi:hypothetical protein
MKLDKTYEGLVTAVKISSKNIKTPEEEKIQKRVGIVKIEFDYVDGDLSELVDEVANNVFYTTVTWDEERVGNFSLDINEIVFPVKIIKISRKNKEDAAKFTMTFETDELEAISPIGNYVKDKDTKTQVKLTKLPD